MWRWWRRSSSARRRAPGSYALRALRARASGVGDGPVPREPPRRVLLAPRMRRGQPVASACRGCRGATAGRRRAGAVSWWRVVSLLETRRGGRAAVAPRADPRHFPFGPRARLGAGRRLPPGASTIRLPFGIVSGRADGLPHRAILSADRSHRVGSECASVQRRQQLRMKVHKGGQWMDRPPPVQDWRCATSRTALWSSIAASTARRVRAALGRDLRRLWMLSKWLTP